MLNRCQVLDLLHFFHSVEYAAHGKKRVSLNAWAKKLPGNGKTQGFRRQLELLWTPWKGKHCRETVVMEKHKLRPSG